MAAVAFFDSLMPRSFFDFALLSFAILVAAMSRQTWLVVGATAFSVLLTTFGLAEPPLGLTVSLTLASRVVAIAALASVGSLVAYAVRRRNALAALHAAADAAKGALTDAVDLLRVTGKLAKIGNWTLDPVTDDVTLSAEAANILDLAAGEAVAVDVLVRRHAGEAGDRMMNRFAAAQAKGASFDEQLPVVTGNGEERWVRLIGQAVGTPTAAGRYRLQGALQDITDYKQAELRNRRQQDRLLLLEAAVSRINDIVLITEADPVVGPGPRIVFVNDAFERRTGYAPAEVIGQTPRVLQGPNTQVDELDRIRNALLAWEPVRAELINYSKDGQEFWLELDISPIADENGWFTHWVAVERDITERKKSERAVGAQATLTALGERLGKIGGFIAVPGRNEIQWSHGVRNILEWDDDRPPPALDETYALYAPQYQDDIAKAIRLCVEEGAPIHIEVEGVTALGRQIWSRIAAEAERDASGNVVRIVGALQDISARKQLEVERRAQDRALQATTERLTAAQRIGNMGAWEYSFATDRFILSDQIYSIYGVSPTAFDHDYATFLQLIHPDDRALVDATHWNSSAQGNGQDIVVRIIRSDGGVRHVHFVSVGEVREDGIVQSGTLQDITKAEIARIALQASEERLRWVVEVSADVVWDWDIAINRIWWNDRIPSRFGYDFDQAAMSLEDWANIIHPDDRLAAETSLFAAIANGDNEWAGEYRLLCAGGSVANVCVLARLIRDDAGKAIRIIGSLNDVTSQRLLEEQLRRSQRLEVVGQLTGGVAHDFNNLLTVMLGNAEMLEEALLQQPRLRPLAILIRKAAERGAELTSRLLAFSRRQPLDPRKIDVNALITSLLPMLRSVLRRHVSIVHTLAADLQSASVDAPQLENAILNLFINSNDAMPDGGEITIETAELVIDGDYGLGYDDVVPGAYIRITVTDSGTGMAPETLEKAFEPFFTTKPVGTGSGLGLSMVYGFAKQSRGLVRISSELGRGTTVALYLPVADTHTRVSELPVEEVAQHGTEHVLLVEDDDLVRTHAETLLQRLGYNVTSVGNGPDALKLLDTEQDFDVLFTDLVMPGGMSGRQLAGRASERRPDLKVILTSGYEEKALAHRGPFESDLHFIPKPYRQADLARILRTVLGGSARP
jgi:PAS domain S-box-containing protein